MRADARSPSQGDAAVVTGAAGFVGRHLVAYLSEIGLRVYGLDRVTPKDVVQGLAGFARIDVLDEEALGRCLGEIKPRYIFHLAANRPAPEGELSVGVNALMTYRVLTCAARLSQPCAIVVAGSAAEYGRSRSGKTPITEEAELRPVGLYGISKVSQWQTARWLAEALRLPVAYSRTFNLTGPGEPPTLVCAALAGQLADIVAGVREGPLVVHSPDHMRDFADVRDAVRAYWLIAASATPECPVFNVCSGQGTSIREIAAQIIDVAGSAVTTKEVQPVSPASDVPWQTGSFASLEAASGWQPEIALRATLEVVTREHLDASGSPPPTRKLLDRR